MNATSQERTPKPGERASSPGAVGSAPYLGVGEDAFFLLLASAPRIFSSPSRAPGTPEVAGVRRRRIQKFLRRQAALQPTSAAQGPAPRVSYLASG